MSRKSALHLESSGGISSLSFQLKEIPVSLPRSTFQGNLKAAKHLQKFTPKEDEEEETHHIIPSVDRTQRDFGGGKGNGLTDLWRHVIGRPNTILRPLLCVTQLLKPLKHDPLNVVPSPQAKSSPSPSTEEAA